MDTYRSTRRPLASRRNLSSRLTESQSDHSHQASYKKIFLTNKTGMEDFERRIRVWHENIRIFEDHVPPRASLKVSYDPSFEFDRTKYGTMRTDIRVIDKDTLDATLDLIEQGMHPLVLNMADIHNPGGCVSCGGGMQEESLFRRTNYHRHLSRSFYPIGEREAVVSFDVDIIRECERDGFEFLKFSKSASFLACPCISMPQLVDNRFSEKDIQLFREKVRLVLSVAHKYGHDSIVLGAWGCGAFGCPPKHVAEIMFAEIEQVEGCFKKIVFAILGKNIDFFHLAENEKKSRKLSEGTSPK